MAKRTKELGLGRGLNALLGDPELPAQGEGAVSLPISQVEPGLNQPRKHFDEGALADLADSIRIHGIIQPLTVRRLASGYYQIIAGERRGRGAQSAGVGENPRAAYPGGGGRAPPPPPGPPPGWRRTRGPAAFFF